MTESVDSRGPVNPQGDSHGLLRVSRCDACGRAEFPARARCPACLSPSKLVAATLPGHLAAVTTVEHPPPGALVPVPYRVGVVEFAEGISVIGRVVGEVVTGDAVVPIGETLSNGAATYVFELAEADP